MSEQNAVSGFEARELFYGRRKGRPLKGAESEALAQSQILLTTNDIKNDLSNLFYRESFNRSFPQKRESSWTPAFAGVSGEKSLREIHLEIGFGAGEHLTACAEAHRDIGFIGAEAYLNGIAKCALKAQQKNFGNLRIWPDDARGLLDRLPASSVSRIYLLYPDPWPKRRHWKRRMICDLNLSRFARILREGGEIHFATDWGNYAAWTLAHFRRDPCFEWRATQASDWLRPWPDWPSTRYEQKAIRENLNPTYLTFGRTNLTESPLREKAHELI